jgi:hypothetical protein
MITHSQIPLNQLLLSFLSQTELLGKTHYFLTNSYRRLH